MVYIFSIINIFLLSFLPSFLPSLHVDQYRSLMALLHADHERAVVRILVTGHKQALIEEVHWKEPGVVDDLQQLCIHHVLVRSAGLLNILVYIFIKRERERVCV